jgi:hypothetical protein
VIFCEKCGTKARDSAIFCSGCGSEIQPDVKTSDSTPHRAKGKKIDIKTSLFAITWLITAAFIGLGVVPNVFKPAELIEFSEIKLSVSDGAYTWIGTPPIFKVNLKPTEQVLNDITLTIEKQDIQGQWSKVAHRDIESAGVIVIDGDPATKAGKAIYRASVFQGERYVESSKTKTIVFLPKKSNFTYVGRIGYRYLTEDEKDKFTCPTQSPCWGVYLHSRAKVSINIQYLDSAAKAISKSVKVDLTKINKVRLVKVPSINGNSQSGYFNHTEKLLSAKDLKRIALEWKKKQQAKPKPQTTNSTPKPQPSATESSRESAQQCFDWRLKLAQDKAIIESYKPSDWSPWLNGEWEAQTALAEGLNSGDLSQAATVSMIIERGYVLRTLISRGC